MKDTGEEEDLRKNGKRKQVRGLTVDEEAEV
jgi:hypothetical protein